MMVSEPDGERDRLEMLADEFVRRQRRGESPSVSEYVARHPELAAEIRDLFPAIATLERLKIRKQQGGAPVACLGAVRLERLGDFRILGEVGRGGMGIVYEALQQSLGRHVAIKVLPKQLLLDERSLRRFRREAKTAARLHHTNIIPVFGVGEHDGYHYIVMQLIRGVGLDAVLVTLRRRVSAGTNCSPGRKAESPQAGRYRNPERLAVVDALLSGRLYQLHDSRRQFADKAAAKVGGVHRQAGHADHSPLPAVSPPEDGLPTDGGNKPIPRAAATPPPSTTAADDDQWRLDPRYWRSVAAIGLQVADAIEYAHRQNTLHRDIKPANLLLDGQGVVWVTDFGLAKAVEQDNVTQTGTVAGTLRYMAPEQLSGQSDARSDIYSLGLTLYEMLTLRPAFEDTSRSGLIRKIMHQPPTPPRKVNPSIPRDLETIILKAIARDAASRYATAGQVADDLRRFLDDRPVAARRITPPERLWRWCRRNPLVASLTFAVLAMVVVAATVAAIGYAQTRRAWMSESKQRQRAEATAELAMEALDQIFHQFAPNRITDAPEMTFQNSNGDSVKVPVQPVISEETAAVLDQMLAFYDRLGKQGSDDVTLRRKVADATRRVGDIRQRLGHFPVALAAYKQAIACYRELLPRAGDQLELETQIASIYNEEGKVYHATNDRDHETASHRQALDILIAASDAPGGDPRFRYELARTYYFLSRKGPPPPPPPPVGRGHDPPPPSPAAVVPSSSRPERVRSRRPFEHEPRRRSLPPRPDDLQQPQQMGKAIELLETLAQQYPATPEYRYLLARCYRDMHPAAFIFSQKAALQANAKAIEILEALVRDFPNVSDFRHALSQTYADSPPPDRSDFVRGDFAAVAESRFRKALKISEQLVAEHPNVPEYVASQAEILFKLAETLRRTGRIADAKTFLHKALDVQSSLARRFPDVAGYLLQTTRFEFALARLERDMGQLADARSLLESSTAQLEAVAAKDPRRWPMAGILGLHYRELLSVLEQMGEPEAVAAVRRRASEHGVQWPAAPPPRDAPH